MGFCQENFENIVTWGVKLQPRNIGFACFSMESWISGVPPKCWHRLSMWIFTRVLQKIKQVNDTF